MKKQLHWLLDAGAHVRRDYSGYFQKHDAPMTESSQRPRLVGLTKEEAWRKYWQLFCEFASFIPRRDFTLIAPNNSSCITR